jgi:hypothetical protein
VHRCALCHETRAPTGDSGKWWEITGWRRWVHPECFLEIMDSIRGQPAAEVEAMIEAAEREEGFDDGLSRVVRAP